jgi:DNA helicase-2/ATP-dependent DNA helicase PcrA
LLYNQTQYNPISRFVSEIPDEYIIREEIEDESFGSYNMYGGGRSYVFGTSDTSRSATVTTQRTASPKGNGYMSSSIMQSASKPAAQKPANIEKFAPGDRVRHLTFGEGEVLSIRDMGADTLYEVMFDKVGTKKLMATYAKLKKA